MFFFVQNGSDTYTFYFQYNKSALNTNHKGLGVKSSRCYSITSSMNKRNSETALLYYWLELHKHQSLVKIFKELIDNYLSIYTHKCVVRVSCSNGMQGANICHYWRYPVSCPPHYIPSSNSSIKLSDGRIIISPYIRWLHCS